MGFQMQRLQLINFTVSWGVVGREEINIFILFHFVFSFQVSKLNATGQVRKEQQTCCPSVMDCLLISCLYFLLKKQLRKHSTFPQFLLFFCPQQFFFLSCFVFVQFWLFLHAVFVIHKYSLKEQIKGYSTEIYQRGL